MSFDNLFQQAVNLAEQYKEEASQLRNALNRLEWSVSVHSQDSGRTYFTCPVCEHYKHAGHSKYCWLGHRLRS